MLIASDMVGLARCRLGPSGSAINVAPRWGWRKARVTNMYSASNAKIDNNNNNNNPALL